MFGHGVCSWRFVLILGQITVDVCNPHILATLVETAGDPVILGPFHFWLLRCLDTTWLGTASSFVFW
jgi:hypothetical protein